jgi:hypothetical protein
MKYEEYTAIAKDLTAENALDVVANLLAKAKEDSVAQEAKDTETAGKLAEVEQKYKDLKVDYIQLYTTGRVTGAPAEDEQDEQEKAAQEAQAKAMDIIAANMNA